MSRILFVLITFMSLDVYGQEYKLELNGNFYFGNPGSNPIVSTINNSKIFDLFANKGIRKRVTVRKVTDRIQVLDVVTYFCIADVKTFKDHELIAKSNDEIIIIEDLLDKSYTIELDQTMEWKNEIGYMEISESIEQ